jgi:uncharacterized membrane protein
MQSLNICSECGKPKNEKGRQELAGEAGKVLNEYKPFFFPPFWRKAGYGIAVLLIFLSLVTLVTTHFFFGDSYITPLFLIWTFIFPMATGIVICAGITICSDIWRRNKIEKFKRIYPQHAWVFEYLRLHSFP